MIQFDGVSKTYRPFLRSAVHAVQDFSLAVADGEVLGIAGPNGAGKSTLIALLLGYQYPTHGRVSINGMPPRQYIERHGIGYVSELIAINPQWNVTNALRRFSVLAGIPAHRVHDRVDAVIQQLGLDEHRDKLVKALSKGNAQRLGIAQSLLRDEQVVVFDEPTHGLDPVWTQKFREIVQQMRRPGRSIVIASHNLDELQRLADRVAIMDHGRLQRLVSTGYEQTPGEIITYRLHVADGEAHVAQVFPGAVAIGNGEFDVVPSSIAHLNQGLAELLARQVMIVGLAPARTRLEEQFREAVNQ